MLHILIDQLYFVSEINNKSDRVDYHLRGAYRINVRRDRSFLSALFTYVLTILAITEHQFLSPICTHGGL